MNIVKRKTKDLKLDPTNLRRHGNENIEMIKRSLTENGQYKPIYVDVKTNIVKIGNGRLQAMRELGWEECWVVEIDFSKHEGMEVMDNRLNELSNWSEKETIDDWLLNDKGVDWWGVDAEKSVELLEKEKKRARKAAAKNRPDEKFIPLCPCCQKPLKKVKAILL